MNKKRWNGARLCNTRISKTTKKNAQTQTDRERVRVRWKQQRKRWKARAKAAKNVSFFIFVYIFFFDEKVFLNDFIVFFFSVVHSFHFFAAYTYIIFVYIWPSFYLYFLLLMLLVLKNERRRYTPTRFRLSFYRVWVCALRAFYRLFLLLFSFSSSSLSSSSLSSLP